MNLSKLFDAQKILDARIELEHPSIEGEDRLTKKILALQVELSELANELPEVFKFWSNKKNNYEKALKEYVDCLHFILSIGSEKYWTFGKVPVFISGDLIDIQFNEMFLTVSNFYVKQWLSQYEQILTVFLSLGHSIGFTWEQIEQAYFEKNAINLQRQDDGY